MKKNWFHDAKCLIPTVQPVRSFLKFTVKPNSSEWLSANRKSFIANGSVAHRTWYWNDGCSGSGSCRMTRPLRCFFNTCGYFPMFESYERRVHSVSQKIITSRVYWLLNDRITILGARSVQGTLLDAGKYTRDRAYLQKGKLSGSTIVLSKASTMKNDVMSTYLDTWLGALLFLANYIVSVSHRSITQTSFSLRLRYVSGRLYKTV